MSLGRIIKLFNVGLKAERNTKMRNTSLRDLKLADSLSHMTEVQMINPANDNIVKEVLAEIGYDVTKGISYIPSYHRDMQGKAAVGFQVIGEYHRDKKYHKFVDTFDRVVMAGLSDVHLAKDMAELLGKRFVYKNDDEAPARGLVDDPRYFSEAELYALGYTGFEDDTEDSFLQDHGGPESDWEMINSQVEALIAVRISLRGE